ncbi:MAG TPA: hypothetical protein VKU80_13445, partial [Planctomycetota bacterium]|nr:hypothetical protein [Planctomycetota bacterium]
IEFFGQNVPNLHLGDVLGLYGQAEAQAADLVPAALKEASWFWMEARPSACTPRDAIQHHDQDPRALLWDFVPLQAELLFDMT